jgi:hypothetical protein
MGKSELRIGAFRESNSGPLAPKARIIPLDQMPLLLSLTNYVISVPFGINLFHFDQTVT